MNELVRSNQRLDMLIGGLQELAGKLTDSGLYENGISHASVYATIVHEAIEQLTAKRSGVETSDQQIHPREGDNRAVSTERCQSAASVPETSGSYSRSGPREDARTPAGAGIASPALSETKGVLQIADELCKAAASFAGDVGLHSDAYLWDKIEAYQNARTAVKASEPICKCGRKSPHRFVEGECGSEKASDNCPTGDWPCEMARQTTTTGTPEGHCVYCSRDMKANTFRCVCGEMHTLGDGHVCKSQKATEKPWTKGGNPVGTSLKGYAHFPYSRVVEVFGEPDYRGDQGDSRVIFDWTITFSDGTVATVYDYKQSKLYGDDPDAPTPEEMKALPSFEWHIGGKSQRAVEFVLNALKSSSEPSDIELIEAAAELHHRLKLGQVELDAEAKRVLYSNISRLIRR